MKLVLLLLALVGSAGVIAGLPAPAVGADNEPVLAPLDGRAVVSAQDGDDFYQNDPRDGLSARIGTLLRTRIAPSLPGALLLLGLSVLFSMINFYTELRRRQRGLRRAFRYLLLWVSVNYVFALLFLLLILPEGMGLASPMSRALLMYCLVATALPELSANIRLQLGRSDERTLDLYKYKLRMSDLITERMDRASAQRQSRDRAFLEAHYESQPDEFVHRFRVFLQEGELSDAEQTYMHGRMDDPAMKSAPAILAAVGGRPALMRKLLDYFADDVERFRESPKARLLTDIRLDPTRDEVHRLVEAGITTARGFLYRTMFEFQRQKLAGATHITSQRLRELRVSTHDAWRRRRRRQIAAAAAGLIGIAAVVLLLAWLSHRMTPNYLRVSTLIAADGPNAAAPTGAHR
jgi:hypothetical protein